MSRLSFETLDSLMIDDIREISLRAMSNIIGEKYYTDTQATEWSSAILETIITELGRLKKPFKYVVTCSILQRTGAALQAATATYMDAQTDGEITVPWSNPYVYASVHIFALQI